MCKIPARHWLTIDGDIQPLSQTAISILQVMEPSENNLDDNICFGYNFGGKNGV